ncbi:MAG: MATE family efflux transporter [Verrucomicrobia bacterium]|nr:MATE family efflux transporter [Verrucomicrobiota bacterium]
MPKNVSPIAYGHTRLSPFAPMSEFWSSVREALRGSRQDFTEVPIRRAILLLAVPMILEMSMESLFAVVDIFWVSRLGAEAVASVGLTEAMLTLIYTVAMGLSIGATATVARRVGEKDPERAAHSAVQVIALGLALSVPIGIAGALLAPRLLGLMGASPDVIAQGKGYTGVMFGGNATVLLLFLGNAIFRGAGDAAIAMRVLWLANGLNIALGPCFIFGLGPFPELGVTGAAVATNIGRGTGVVYLLVRLWRGGAHIRVQRRHIGVELQTMATLIRLSATGMFQTLVGMASWLALIRILSGFGSAALAGYTIAIRIVIFALLPSWGLSNAAATMVGQNLGAGKSDRAEQSVWHAGFCNMIFLGAVGTLFVLFAEPLIDAFTQDTHVAPHGVSCLRTVSLGFLFYAYGMVLGAAFNGAGDIWTPTFINLFCFWLWELPVAYALAHSLRWGPGGVFAAITIAFSTYAVVGAAIFKQGRWKLKRV